jgi:hypothetical protein
LSSQRKLTTHQKAVLVQVLRTFADVRVRIRYPPSASDGLSYAEDFLSVFKAIGWNAADPEPEPEPFGAPPGMALVTNEAELPPCAEALRDVLRIYGIEAEVECSSSAVSDGTLLLSVGRAS